MKSFSYPFGPQSSPPTCDIVGESLEVEVGDGSAFPFGCCDTCNQ